MSSGKTIHSRANKEIGDVIEDKWEITAKRVIAEPLAGDRSKNIAPRFGIYEYEVKPVVQRSAAKPSRTTRQPAEPNVGGTRREASSVPLIVRRVS